MKLLYAHRRSNGNKGRQLCRKLQTDIRVHCNVAETDLTVEMNTFLSSAQNIKRYSEKLVYNSCRSAGRHAAHLRVSRKSPAAAGQRMLMKRNPCVKESYVNGKSFRSSDKVL
jgi:hypothetical protein